MIITCIAHFRYAYINRHDPRNSAAADVGKEIKVNKRTARLIHRHTIICLCIKVIVAKMSGKKMMKGQITILKQILIILMDR